MNPRAFLLLGMLFFFVGCQVSYPSPFGTGSMYEGEINSKSARVEIIFPWAPLLEDDKTNVQEETEDGQMRPTGRKLEDLDTI